MLKPRIPTPAVPVTDPETGLMARDWYNFFLQAGQAVVLDNFANDIQAAAGGVPIGGLYRTGSVVKVRT